jgi:hypothetical protein
MAFLVINDRAGHYEVKTEILQVASFLFSLSSNFLNLWEIPVNKTLRFGMLKHSHGVKSFFVNGKLSDYMKWKT